MVIEVSDAKILMKERNKLFQVGHELWFAGMGSILILFYPYFIDKITPPNSFRDYWGLVGLVVIPFASIYSWIKLAQTMRRDTICATIDTSGISIVNQKNGRVSKSYQADEVISYRSCLSQGRNNRSHIELLTRNEKIKLDLNRFEASSIRFLQEFDLFMETNYPNATRIE